MVRHGDIIITGGDRAADRAVQRDAAAGEVQRVQEGIYVAGKRPIEEAVFSQWAPILAHFAPGAVVSGRTALQSNPWRERGKDGRPLYPGWVFATHTDGTSPKRISLPGLEIRSTPGPGPLEGDIPFLGVHLPSEARLLLDNLKPSRSREGASRTAGREAVERQVERLLAKYQEEGLRNIRLRAERIAPALDAAGELKTLQDIIGAVLGTRESELKAADVAARNRKVDPYDPDCMERLKGLALLIGTAALAEILDPHKSIDQRACVSFIEAYFTNYIEGTMFLIDKARRIVFENEPVNDRPADGRDITQTFGQVSRLHEGMAPASSFDEFVQEIKERNASLLSARPEKMPGVFKTEPNRAGNTVFVKPELVVGTLREGWAMLSGLKHPFARGTFLHALLVLVHPFNDGNGRLARIMMTKELVRAGHCRVIVPTVYRSDYIGGMRALAVDGRPDPYFRAMVRCQRVSSQIAEPDLNRTIELWASTHAFLEDERDAQFTSPDPTAKIEWRDGIPAPASYWKAVDDRHNATDGSSGLVFER